MRPIDADKLRMLFASGVRVYDGMCKIEDVMHNIDNAPTIDADTYFDAVDRIKPCPNCRYMHIHKMLSEYGQAPWVSVKDRLPELPDKDYCFVRVLAAVKGWESSVELIYERTMLRGKHKVERWKYWDKIFTLEVTHWMPLPEPPKGE